MRGAYSAGWAQPRSDRPGLVRLNKNVSETLDCTDRYSTMCDMNAPEDTRIRIILAARDLMARRSYAETGVAGICETAGVGKSSFYHFFPGKRELTLAVLDSHYADFKAGMLDQVASESLAPLARLKRLGELLYQFQKSTAQEAGSVPGCPFGSMAAEVSTMDERIRESLMSIFRRIEAMFRETLKEARSLGQVDDIDIDATARAMLAYMEGVMLLAKNSNDPEVIRELLPVMTEIRVPAKPGRSKK